MPTQATLLAFVLLSVGLIAMPGPSNLFLLAHGIGHGRRSAMAAMTGIQTAAALRVLLAAAGLSALLASSAIAFNIIRWAGIGYLVFLGVRALQARGSAAPAAGTRTPLPLRHSARKGFLVGIGNPKMVLFYLAFLPQFIHPDQGPETVQILILGTVFWALAAVWDTAFAWASGAIGTWLHDRPRRRALQPRLEGITYLGLATWAACSGSHSRPR